MQKKSRKSAVREIGLSELSGGYYSEISTNQNDELYSNSLLKYLKLFGAPILAAAQICLNSVTLPRRIGRFRGGKRALCSEVEFSHRKVHRGQGQALGEKNNSS